MKQVFAVSSGSYSDYRVNAIFSSRELAKEYMAAVSNSDYNEIEVYELDPPTVDLLLRGYSVWRVLMLHDGTTETVTRTDNDYYYVEDVPRHWLWERTKAPAYEGTGIPDALDSHVWAKTEQQAIKIVNEKRAQMIADGRWK